MILFIKGKAEAYGWMVTSQEDADLLKRGGGLFVFFSSYLLHSKPVTVLLWEGRAGDVKTI